MMQTALTRLLLCFSFLSAAIWAQENSGRILGTVLDVTGASVPGAKIVATSARVPRGIETGSDDHGNYILPNLPLDVWTVTVSKDGFNTVRRGGFDVKLGSEITYNAQMNVGQLASTVEVTDTAVSLDTTSARSATNITIGFRAGAISIRFLRLLRARGRSQRVVTREWVA